MIPDLRDVDPDDAYNSVPYEKGHTFLFYLEDLLGGPGNNLFSFILFNSYFVVKFTNFSFLYIYIYTG